MQILLIICIVLTLVVIVASIPAVFIIYRYTRPKTRPIRTMLIGEVILVVLLLTGIGISLLWPQGCAHPMPDLVSGKPDCASGNLNIGGSTALQPLVSAIAQSYKQQCSGANFNFVPTKSETGVDSVEDGSINIGNSDTFATTQNSDLTDKQIAIAVFAVIINSSVGITNMTANQLQNIYSGKYTNWKDLGGPDLAIQALSRGTGSGTRYTFDHYILNGVEQVSQLTPITSTQDMISNVQNIPGAIGYAALHDVLANSQSLIIVTIDGVPAAPATVINNTYHFWNIEHMYTKQDHVTPLATAFISYMGNSTATQIMQNFSFISIHEMNTDLLSTKCPQKGQ